MRIILHFIISCFLVSSSFAQSNCSNALVLTPGSQQCGDSNGFSGDFPSDGSSPINPCSINHNDDEYWFTYSPGVQVDVAELTLSSISTLFTGIFVLDNCPSSSPSCIVSDVNLASTADIVVSFPVTSGTVYKIVVATFGPPDGTTFCIDAVETLCLSPTVSIPASPIDLTNCPTTVDYTISIDDLMDSNSLLISTDDGTGSPAGTGGSVNSVGDFIITNIPVPQSNWTIKIAHENNPSCDITLGPFELICPSANNVLCDALEIVVDANYIIGNNAYSDNENLEPEGSCWVGGGDLNSVWYSFVAPNSEEVVVSTDYANTPLHDTHISIYSVGDCSDMTTLTEIECDEESGIQGPNGSAAIAYVYGLTANESYYIQVDGKENAIGEFHISVKEITPTNDNCASAKILISQMNGGILIDEYFAGATSSGYGTSICDNNSTPTPADLWYKVGTASGMFSVEVEPGPNSDIVLSVYTGCFTQLFQYCADLGGSGITESITFNADAGTIYIRVYEKSISGESFDILAVLPSLPIVLEKFNVKAERRGNNVTWSTLSETNSDYVEVQNSPNGSTKWEVIGKVVTQGESTSRVNYELFDSNPYELTYYRLNAVDKDGSSEFSNIINIRRSDVLEKMTLVPNPAYESITVQATSATEEMGTIKVVDMTGELVEERKVGLRKGLNTVDINLDALQAGLYLISLQTEDGIQVEKFVKQ